MQGVRPTFQHRYWVSVYNIYGFNNLFCQFLHQDQGIYTCNILYLYNVRM